MSKKRNAKYQMKQAENAQKRWVGAQKILKLCSRAAPIDAGSRGIFNLGQVSGMNI